MCAPAPRPRRWEAKFEALEDAVADAQEASDTDTGIGSLVRAALNKETGLNKQGLA